MCSMLAQLGRRSAIALKRVCSSSRPCSLRVCTSFSIATQQKQHFHESAQKQSDAQAQRSVTSDDVPASSSEAAMTPAKLRAQAKELQFLQRKSQEVHNSLLARIGSVIEPLERPLQKILAAVILY
jgi:hypothetical protein